MKFVLQRAYGDCAIAAIATLLEQAYEDVYLAAAKVDPKSRGRNGVHLTAIVKICKSLGATLVKKVPTFSDEEEGLLVVEWQPGSRHEEGVQHLVAMGHGVIIDPADGVILLADEYLARERASHGAFLELR